MAKDDYFVVMYKILAYLYQCLKDGVKPNIDKAKEVVGINKVYWNAVICDCIENGYIRTPIKFINLEDCRDISVTSKGIEYLEENSHLQKAKNFLGVAFEATLKVAVQATKAIG